MNGRKKFVSLVQIVTTVFLLLSVLVGYMFFSESRAERKAKEFCDRIKVGDSTVGIFERALERGAVSRGAHWQKGSGDSDWTAVTFNGYMPLSRHICWITAADGKIANAKYVYAD